MFTYDLTAAPEISKVRLLIGDTVDAGHLFEDPEIAAFLAMNGDNVRLAAAQALESIATNQVMVLKVIRRLDLSTDGAAVARELRQQAASLRDQAESGIDDPEGLFGIAELAVDIFGRREILVNRALRGAR